MKRTIIAIAIAIVIANLFSSCSKQNKEESMKEISDRVFALADSQFKLLASQLEDGEFPISVEPGDTLDKYTVEAWTSGFFPGSLWLTYEQTGDEEVKKLAERFTRQMSTLLDHDTDHDLGFQVNCSYGNAYRITGDSLYLPMMVNAAKRLSERFNPVVGCTRSWNHGEWEYPVIMDNMMNLELLLSVGNIVDSIDYSDVAKTHADTTIKNHFREDFSTWHLVNYSAKDGHVINKQTVQGFSDDSMWARGEAWALYGYTMMYRFTDEERYLKQACSVADLLLKRLPEDGIPYWDFDCTDIPNTYRDASAACIMASAFVELSQMASKPEYRAMAEKQIRTLTSPEYLVGEGELHGFLLKHSVGHLPGDSQIDVPLTYADYYLLEALRRLTPHA